MSTQNAPQFPNTQGFAEWLNDNEARAYPLSSSATTVSDAGDRLPSAVITDISVAVPYVDYTLGLRISSVYVSDTIISVTVSNDAGGLLTGTYPTESVIPYRALSLTAVEENVTGWITFGTFEREPRARYVFSGAAQSGLEARCVRVLQPAGVTGIRQRNAPDGQAARGIVRLTGDSVFSFKGDPETNTIRITLTTDQPIGNRCLGGPHADTCGAPPLKTINGVGPDADGKIYLRFM